MQMRVDIELSHFEYNRAINWNLSSISKFEFSVFHSDKWNLKFYSVALNFLPFCYSWCLKLCTIICSSGWLGQALRVLMVQFLVRLISASKSILGTVVNALIFLFNFCWRILVLYCYLFIYKCYIVFFFWAGILTCISLMLVNPGFSATTEPGMKTFPSFSTLSLWS